MTDLEQSKLPALASTEERRHVLGEIRARQRGRSETTLDVFEKCFREVDPDGRSRKQAMEFVRDLERANAGKVILGRGGKVTRFHWYEDMRSVAQRALDASDEPLSIDEAEPASGQQAMKRFSFPLRKDQDLTIEVPEDLTADERNRLADFIRILPV